MRFFDFGLFGPSFRIIMGVLFLFNFLLHFVGLRVKLALCLLEKLFAIGGKSFGSLSMK
jgi:hypothetical protein